MSEQAIEVGALGKGYHDIGAVRGVGFDVAPGGDLRLPRAERSGQVGHEPGAGFKTFIYPCVLAMPVPFTAIFSAAPIARDREDAGVGLPRARAYNPVLLLTLIGELLLSFALTAFGMMMAARVTPCRRS